MQFFNEGTVLRGGRRRQPALQPKLLGCGAGWFISFFHGIPCCDYLLTDGEEDSNLLDNDEDDKKEDDFDYHVPIN
jgi:hypothetical protein